MITAQLEFKELEHNYLDTSGNIDYMCLAAFRENNDPQVPWLHKPTLARWLFGVAQEFFSDYRRKVKDYLVNHPKDTDFFAGTTCDLAEDIENFRLKLRNSFPNDNLLMEATR